MSVSDSLRPINIGKTNFFSSNDLTTSMGYEEVFSAVANTAGAIVYHATIVSKGTIASFPVLVAGNIWLLGELQAANVLMFLEFAKPIFIPAGNALRFNEFNAGVTAHVLQTRTVNYTLL